jgi:predicted dehydrogenase
VLGASRIAYDALVTPAKETGDRLVVVAARDGGRARRFAAEHGVERVARDYAEVIADAEVELVYNPLANALHGRWNAAAARAGKHVLSEKPFAANAAEARTVADAARAAGVTAVEGFHYVHHPLMRRLHAVLASGEIGEPRAVEAHITMPAPPDDDPRWSFPLAGGAVMDLGCYALHAHRTLAPWAGGEPQVVAARAHERDGHPGVDEWLEADLAFPGGASGFVRCSMDDDWRVTLRVVGSAGELLAANFALPFRDDRLVVRTASGERTEHLGTRSTYLYQLEALREHLREGAPFPVDAEDAVRTAGLIDAAYTAAGLPLRTP